MSGDQYQHDLTDIRAELARLRTENEALRGQIAALRGTAKAALDFTENAGRWCDSNIEEHGSAWHISPHDDARWGELQEALGRALVDTEAAVRAHDAAVAAKARAACLEACRHETTADGVADAIRALA